MLNVVRGLFGITHELRGSCTRGLMRRSGIRTIFSDVHSCGLFSKEQVLLVRLRAAEPPFRVNNIFQLEWWETASGDLEKSHG
jgi:hypothetical protein